MPDGSLLFTSRFLDAVATASGIPTPQVNRRVTEAFQEIVARAGTTLSLEIGAFEAGYSRWASETLEGATVMAFEANPFVYDHFKAEVQAAGVDYRNLCVGPETGKVTLNVPSDFDGHEFAMVNQMSSLGSSLRTEHDREVEVDSVRLDEYLTPADDEKIAAWIDVEGAYDVVLNGSREILRRTQAVYIEVESEPIWSGQWLDVDVLRFFDELGMVPVLRDQQRPFQYNLVFVTQELAAEPWVAEVAAAVFRPFKPRAGKRERQDAAPLPPPVPRSALARAQGLLRPGLRAENAALREQNKRLRRRLRKLRKAQSTSG